MNESQWRLFCIVFLGSLCVAMVWAELSRASTAPVGAHWSVFRHEMIHEDLRQEDPVFSRPLGGKQDVRMFGGPVRMHLCRLNAVDTVSIADALRFSIVGMTHDDNVIEIGKIFRETVGQKIRVVFTHNNGFKFHDEIL